MKTRSELRAPHRPILDHPTGILSVGGVIGLGIFIVDIGWSSVALGGAPYVVLILASLWFPWRYATLSMTIIGSAFAGGSYVFAAGAGARELPVANLGLDLAVLWVSAILAFRYLASRQMLEDPEGRLRALVNTAVDGVIIIDGLGIVKDFNPACEKLFGYPAQEVVGHNVSMLMPAP
jgi:PAS domain-containing protein